MEFLGLLLALLIGMLLGLLGGGGSILAVPVLVYVVGLDPKLAIALSLGVVGIASLAGAVPHVRGRTLDLRTAILFAAGSAAGALGGAMLSRLVDGRVQLILFAVVMLVVAITMLRPGRDAAGAPDEAAHEGAPLLLTLLRGAGVGVLTGFVGVGGGFLIVPALVLLAGMPVKRAVGTSLLVIAINSVAGLAGYLVQSAIRERIVATVVAGMPLTLYLAIFTSIAVAGVALGVRIGRRLDAGTIRRAFAVALLCMAAFILAENGGRLLGV